MIPLSEAQYSQDSSLTNQISTTQAENHIRAIVLYPNACFWAESFGIPCDET